MQSKTQSLIESATNIAIGYFVALFSQLLIFPLYGVNIPLSDNILIGVWFTAISLVRSYALRRWFNKKQLHNAQPAVAHNTGSNGEFSRSSRVNPPLSLNCRPSHVTRPHQTTTKGL